MTVAMITLNTSTSSSSFDAKRNSTSKPRKPSFSASSFAQLHTLPKRARFTPETQKKQCHIHIHRQRTASENRGNHDDDDAAPANAKMPSININALLSEQSSPPGFAAQSDRPSLTLDLSNLPSPSRPIPPSNTLIITELHNLLVFQPASLASIREHIAAIATLNSFSPLPSFRRIVCSFLNIEDAVKVREVFEETTQITAVFEDCGLQPRIYYGEPTPIEGTEEAKKRKLLEAPHSDKLFFISPPPSPPHGWVLRNEEPPNKDVHATDLAEALARLGTHHQQQQQQTVSDPPSPVSVASSADEKNPRDATGARTRTGSWPSSAGAAGAAGAVSGRSRSSTLIYHPNDHGGLPNLPAVMVEDTSIVEADDDFVMVNADEMPKGPFERTARPPVELMH